MDRSDIKEVENIQSEDFIEGLLSAISRLVAENTVLNLKLKKAVFMLEQHSNSENIQF